MHSLISVLWHTRSKRCISGRQFSNAGSYE